MIIRTARGSGRARVRSARCAGADAQSRRHAHVRGQRRAAQLRLPRADSSFAFIHPVRPHYSTLLKFDTANYPDDQGRPRRIVDRRARRPHLHVQAAQGRQVPRRHRRSPPRTSRRPTTGCASRRRACNRCARRRYTDIATIETPDPNTVVFKLSQAQRVDARRTSRALGLRLQRGASSRRTRSSPSATSWAPARSPSSSTSAGSHWRGQQVRRLLREGQALPRRLRAIFIGGAPMVNALAGGRGAGRVPRPFAGRPRSRS